MPKLSDFRGGSYLRYADLGGKDHLVQIEDIAVKTIGEGDKAKDKLVVYFEGKSKALVLNNGNLEVLETLFGPETNDAIGGTVILHPDPSVMYAGQRVGGIRIQRPRAVEKKAAPAKSTAEILNDDIPFAAEWRG